jgi:hypothetical protein
MAGVVGKALRGFGKALGKKGDGKAIKSVPIAKRLTERRKNTEDLFKIRHKHGLDPVKANIQTSVKKTSAVNDRFDKAQKSRKDYNKNLKKKALGGASAGVVGAVGAHEGAKKKFPKYKKTMESDVVIKDGKLGLRPKKKK